MENERKNTASAAGNVRGQSGAAGSSLPLRSAEENSGFPQNTETEGAAVPERIREYPAAVRIVIGKLTEAGYAAYMVGGLRARRAPFPRAARLGCDHLGNAGRNAPRF